MFFLVGKNTSKKEKGKQIQFVIILWFYRTHSLDIQKKTKFLFFCAHAQCK